MIVERPADTKRLAILDLLSRGYRPVQIAGELDVSRQYVHLSAVV
jgi:DNA-binding NarL/FixJ family response regulator